MIISGFVFGLVAIILNIIVSKGRGWFHEFWFGFLGGWFGVALLLIVNQEEATIRLRKLFERLLSSFRRRS